MIRLTILLGFLPLICLGQKMKNVDDHLMIDTTLTTSQLPSYSFNEVKKWLIMNIPDRQDLGEVPGQLISSRMVVKYAAAMGTKQKYEQVLNIAFSEGAITIKINNLYTLKPDGSRGSSADKFFIKDDGTLKSMGKVWYRDVEDKFRILSTQIATAIK